VGLMRRGSIFALVSGTGDSARALLNGALIHCCADCMKSISELPRELCAVCSFRLILLTSAAYDSRRERSLMKRSRSAAMVWVVDAASGCVLKGSITFSYWIRDFLYALRSCCQRCLPASSSALTIDSCARDCSIPSSCVVRWWTDDLVPVYASLLALVRFPDDWQRGMSGKPVLEPLSAREGGDKLPSCAVLRS
jgi:hypothetical protein